MLAGVDLEQGFEVRVQLGKELHAHGFLVDVTVGVAVGEVLGEPVALLGVQRHPRGEFFVHQHTAQGAADDAFILAADT
ncbi:hypothetical protein D3C81_2180480 [compost metagenome]